MEGVGTAPKFAQQNASLMGTGRLHPVPLPFMNWPIVLVLVLVLEHLPLGFKIEDEDEVESENDKDPSLVTFCRLCA